MTVDCLLESYPSLRMEEAMTMRVDLALNLLSARRHRTEKAAKSVPQVTRGADGVVHHHIKSFEQLQAVMGGIR